MSNFDIMNLVKEVKIKKKKKKKKKKKMVFLIRTAASGRIIAE